MTRRSEFSARLSRRGFLGSLAASGALVLGVRIGRGAPVSLAAGRFAPGLWLAIEPDDTVTIVAHRSEMGTGIRTCLPLVVAEELGADLAKVRLDQAVGDEKYGSQNTDGSRSIRNFIDVMRKAGAGARLMLERAAAQQWKVAPRECTTRDHQVHHEASGRSLSFGALVVRAAKLPLPADADLTYRAAKDYRYVGKEIAMLDQPDIVTGRAQYGIDVHLDGMKYAAIARCPVMGGTAQSHDDSETLKVPGVEKVIALKPPPQPSGFAALGGIAVIARDTWSAVKGRDALKVAWDLGAHTSYETEKYEAELATTVKKAGEVVLNRGDAAKALAGAAKKHAAVYALAHLAHASMETPVATAHVTKDGCVAWAPVQNPQAARDEVAKALGIDKEKVTIHVTLLGGGFGRKSKPDFVCEAALLSREVGAPVKVQWTREDDIRHDYYHSNAAVYCEGGVDAAGKPTAWLQRSAFPSISSTFAKGVTSPTADELSLGFTDVPFAVPNLRAEKGEAHAHTRIGWLRSVCNVWHAFAIGSFADELAGLAGKDSLAFLLDLIGPARLIDPAKDGGTYSNYDEKLSDYPVDAARLRAVLERAAKEGGWGRSLERGRGQGLAVHRSFASYIAMAVEVAVTRDGRLEVPRVDVVVDCGRAINPDRVRAQMEGSVVFAHSLARTGEITFKGGAVEQSNFQDYRVARIHEIPREIHVHIMESDDMPGGVGEPAVPPYAPALANAIHAATGKRVRRLPLSHADLSWS